MMIYSDLNSLTVHQLKAGDRVLFGNCPQTTDVPEPIIWRVLDMTGGRALLISEALLDTHRYDAQSNSWQTSELREWLNSTFLQRAFGAREQERLAGINGDLVTCLSMDEAGKYFGSDDDRTAKPTAYAVNNGAHVEPRRGTFWWWLRSDGAPSDQGAHVGTRGRVHSGGPWVSIGFGCVRPVVSVSLE